MKLSGSFTPASMAGGRKGGEREREVQGLEAEAASLAVPRGLRRLPPRSHGRKLRRLFANLEDADFTPGKSRPPGVHGTWDRPRGGAAFWTRPLRAQTGLVAVVEAVGREVRDGWQCGGLSVVRNWPRLSPPPPFLMAGLQLLKLRGCRKGTNPLTQSLRMAFISRFRVTS